MKINLLLTMAAIFSLGNATITAQELRNKLDIRFGLGPSLHGTGDFTLPNLETELNYKFSKLFTVTLSAQTARVAYDYNQCSFAGIHSNLLFSPFNNQRKNNFRVGGGIAYYGVSHVWMSSAYYTPPNPNPSKVEYEIEKRKSLGFNLVIEDDFTIRPNVILGAKLFTTPYFNGDINSGILFKVGFKIK